MQRLLLFAWLTAIAITVCGCPPDAGDDDDDDSAVADDDVADDDLADDDLADDDVSDDDVSDDDVSDDDVSDDDVSDDDVSDDDVSDDDVSDDDVSDDDVSDDDTTGAGMTMTGEVQTEEIPAYHAEQDLVGQESLNNCPGCEFSFDITYTTTASGGSCMWCMDLADGQHTLGYDADYMYGAYGPYEAVFYDYGGTWSFWYSAYANYGGHDVVFLFYTYYYTYIFYQYGFWDIAGGVDADGDGYSTLWDCDDGDATVYPGATEVCDGVDNDCDPTTDDTQDLDADGFSAVCDDDCDDTDSTVYPGAPELCDGLDTDCDGSIAAYETDADGDGYMLCDSDCDDGDATAYPGAYEFCDGVDNDCDGVADNGCGGGLTGMVETQETDGTPFYVHSQDLTGGPSATNCPGCDYTYDITYTTTAQSGTCLWCWDLTDGVHTLGYDSDYMYGPYGPYEAIFYDYGGSWNFWYSAYAGYGGHGVTFFFYTYYYQYALYQYGYWDF